MQIIKAHGTNEAHDYKNISTQMLRISDKSITNPLEIFCENFLILDALLTDRISMFPHVLDYYRQFGKVLERAICKKTHYFLNNINNRLNTNHLAFLIP